MTLPSVWSYGKALWWTLQRLALPVGACVFVGWGTVWCVQRFGPERTAMIGMVIGFSTLFLGLFVLTIHDRATFIEPTRKE